MSKSYFQVLCLIRYFAAWADNALDGSEEELPPCRALISCLFARNSHPSKPMPGRL